MRRIDSARRSLENAENFLREAEAREERASKALREAVSALRGLDEREALNESLRGRRWAVRASALAIWAVVSGLSIYYYEKGTRGLEAMRDSDWVLHCVVWFPVLALAAAGSVFFGAAILSMLGAPWEFNDLVELGRKVRRFLGFVGGGPSEAWREALAEEVELAEHKSVLARSALRTARSKFEKAESRLRLMEIGESKARLLTGG